MTEEERKRQDETVRRLLEAVAARERALRAVRNEIVTQSPPRAIR